MLSHSLLDPKPAHHYGTDVLTKCLQLCQHEEEGQQLLQGHMAASTRGSTHASSAAAAG